MFFDVLMRKVCQAVRVIERIIICTIRDELDIFAIASSVVINFQLIRCLFL